MLGPPRWHRVMSSLVRIELVLGARVDALSLDDYSPFAARYSAGGATSALAVDFTSARARLVAATTSRWASLVHAASAAAFVSGAPCDGAQPAMLCVRLLDEDGGLASRRTAALLQRRNKVRARVRAVS
jgi:hypothetical protein